MATDTVCNIATRIAAEHLRKVSSLVVAIRTAPDLNSLSVSLDEFAGVVGSRSNASVLCEMSMDIGDFAREVCASATLDEMAVRLRAYVREYGTRKTSAIVGGLVPQCLVPSFGGDLDYQGEGIAVSWDATRHLVLDGYQVELVERCQA